MIDADILGARGIAKHQRKLGEPEVAGIIDGLCDRVENLREAIIRGPCTQHSIPCGWPCDSEIPCWKQIALGSDSGQSEGTPK